jgi:superfamily I DNA and/or RNA helicase
VVLLSTVRSNIVKLVAPVDDADESQLEVFEKQASAKFGHLRSSNRLNVAMSRQRRYLLVLGDADMYRGDVAMKAVPEMCDFLELCETESRRVN